MFGEWCGGAPGLSRPVVHLICLSICIDPIVQYTAQYLQCTVTAILSVSTVHSMYCVQCTVMTGSLPLIIDRTSLEWEKREVKAKNCVYTLYKYRVNS